MSLKRVCLLVDTVAHNAGAELQVIETATRLNRERFEVHVCCLENSPRLQELAAHSRIQYFPIQSVYSRNGLTQMRLFRRYLHDNRIDLLHTYMEKAAIFGVLSTLGSRRPLVITSRLNMGYWYTGFYRLFFRFLNSFTTRIMANSEAVKKSTVQSERASPQKVDVVYQGVDVVRYSGQSAKTSAAETIGIPSGATVIGIVSNLRGEKGVELFIRAAQYVAKEIPNAVFLIVGNGTLRESLGEMSRALNVGDRVFFSDGRGTVPEYLSRMSIGCLSSKGEGFSNAILEYMAAGLPVVATDVGGNSEAIVDGQTGYLVRDRQPESFAQPVIRLLKDPVLRKSLGDAGRQRCQTHFEIGGTVRKLEDYYLSLLEGPR